MTITRRVERQARAEEAQAAVPDLTPWREVGWIFRDGGCVAIERRGDETRACAQAD